MTARSTSRSTEIDWQVPESWYVAPPGATARESWATGLAAKAPDPSLRAALDAALGVLSTDPAAAPFVVLADEAPWIDATGWLSAWPFRVEDRDQIEAFFARETDARDSLHSFESYDVEAEDGGGRCLMLHTFEAAAPDDDALVERISAFLLDADAGVTQQLCLVTRNLLAFEDLPALAAAVLDRSTPITGGAE